MAPLIWLVTGSTSGIGGALVQHIVARGDKVIASGRQVRSRLGDLQSDSFALLELDITASSEVITQKIKQAWEIYGHIDVLVNNAGMSAMSAAEEASDAFTSNMFAVNLFGPMAITKAILPYMRTKGRGTICFTSSSTSWTSLPFMSHYAASKAALSQYVECIRKELAPLGIRAVAFESGGMPTHLGQPRETTDGAASFGNEGAEIKAYQAGLAGLGGMFMSDPLAFMPGDLDKVAGVIVDVVKGEGLAEGKKLPVRVLFGSDAYESVMQKLDECARLFGDWKDLTYSTDRDGYGHVTKGEYMRAVSILDGDE
ncbi:hypothetical protein QBC37DRAFT_384477 [Rhypophila decipiens]|uniref:Uncharacterized protein n=1 Tax=Rhypophila decipiens TaxID=261697 RepID=A0AAN6YED6_9PEZI|nr:hypothetical protein QBC37DRAFT_384477 [Rhypophila decipiens]